MLAATIEGGADLIITQNMKDFPRGILSDFGLLAQKPENLILEISRKDPLIINQIVEELYKKVRKQKYQVKNSKIFLKRAGLPRLAKITL